MPKYAARHIVAWFAANPLSRSPNPACFDEASGFEPSGVKPPFMRPLTRAVTT
jgi:hypothetical protein